MTDLLRISASATLTALTTAKRAAITVSEAGPDDRPAAILALGAASTQAKASALAFKEGRTTSLRVLSLIA